MADARYRVRAGDPDFGHVCPDCAGPKALQSRRCAACFTDWKRAHPELFAMHGADNPNWKGGHPRVRPVKGTSSTPATDHPWRLQEHAGAVAHRRRLAA